jgi:hypothetical protein
MPVTCRTLQEAVDLMRRCLGFGEVVPSKHFRDELAGDDLTIEDAWTVLRSGNIYDAPEPDIRTGEWKYRMEGYTPDGQWLAIVFCFRTRGRAFLITVFSVEERRRNK